MSTREETPVSILLVEDNDIDVEITKRVVRRSGVDAALRIAKDGKEALEILDQDQRRGFGEGLPQLLLLDLAMPGIDGWEMLRRVKRSPELCRIPVAVLTGATDERSMLDCLDLGSNMFYLKPMDRRDLAELVRAVRHYWRLMERLDQDLAREARAE